MQYEIYYIAYFINIGSDGYRINKEVNPLIEQSDTRNRMLIVRETIRDVFVITCCGIVEQGEISQTSIKLKFLRGSFYLDIEITTWCEVRKRVFIFIKSFYFIEYSDWNIYKLTKYKKQRVHLYNMVNQYKSDHDRILPNVISFSNEN